MLRFTPIALQDLPVLRNCFCRNPDRLCDVTVGGEFLWRDYYSVQWAEYAGALCLMAHYPEEDFIAFSYPIGGDEDAALEALARYAKAQGIPIIFCPASQTDTAKITSRWPAAVIEPQRRWYDYLYAAQDLRELAGRKFGGQRNHINRFKKENPGWRFEHLCTENLPQVKEFYSELLQQEGKQFASMEEETAKTWEVLDTWPLYGFVGGVLFADDRVVAFSLAETAGDTLYVHIEKASRAVHGAYPMIVQQTACAFTPGKNGEVVWIIREDDAGDEGLRTVKLSYHPAQIIPKNKITVSPEMLD